MHTTIYSICESPKDKNLIWVGTDDGNLQLTRDAGKTWTNVAGNVPGLPKNSWVSWVQASNFDAATAYAAFDRHTFGDMAPCVFRTTDYGKTWTPLVSLQDAKSVRGYAHVIKEDLEKPDLLFLGTEVGRWISMDGGRSWAQFKGNDFPAGKRSGLNRVTWSMREKAPRVPPAAQIAFASSRGPRLVPGDYTVRLTKAGKAYETKLTIGLDRRAKFTDEDRKAQYDAAMKVHTLFNDESALMDRILSLRRDVAKAASAVPENDPMKKSIKGFDDKVENVSKKIVATKEGGAITGEERLREHTDQLYGALLSYEGKPGDYQIAYTHALRRELGDVTKEFDQLLTKDLPGLNDSLKSKGKPAIAAPPAKVAITETEFGSGTMNVPTLLR